VAARRTEIYDALTARLKDVALVRTCEQRLRAYDDVPDAEQPAVFVVATDQSQQYQGRGFPPIWTLRFKLYVYARIPGGDSRATGHDALMPLLDAIEDALLATDEEKARDKAAWNTTLGGYCSHARISGTVVTDEGALGEQAVAMVPIEVLTTAIMPST
jgi:hypothetical protein